MNWLVVTVVGVGTFAMRASFIGGLGKRKLPLWAERPLRYVAPAVLAALVLPAVILREGNLDITPLGNPRFLAAVLASIVAWRVRNVAAVIVVGMTSLWLL